MNQIWLCIITDFKQRTRQQSFVVTLLAMSVLTLLFFPAPDAHYQTLVINDYRGIYNSAWIGICLAMLNVLFLPLICFYLVKNALELDRKSMTSELIAATPISKFNFLFAKWCTNVIILITIVLTMLLSSIIIQLYYGESYLIDLWALAWPQIIFVLPVLLAISSIAIMFEASNWLKGGLGNLVYFFLWVGSIVQTIESVSGIGMLLNNLETEVAERFPLHIGSTNIGISAADNAELIKTFVWQGIEPTITHLLGALPLLLISLFCFICAFIFFDRFSQSVIVQNKNTSWLNRLLTTKVISPLDSLFTLLTQHFSFTRLLRLELKLLLKGHSTYWLIGLVALNIIQLFISVELLINIILPISWLWCALVISQLGQIEQQANTFELIAYSRKTLIRSSLASYFSAYVLLILVSLGGIIRFTAMAEWPLLMQLSIAIAFTVALAYFCGTFSGSRRMFEVLYPAIWYLGPIQAALYVDFFGVNSAASWQADMPYYFLATSVGLVILSIRAKKLPN